MPKYSDFENTHAFRIKHYRKQTTDQVWTLFIDLYFLVKWNRCVEQIIFTSINPVGVVGYTFDTIAPLQKGKKRRCECRTGS